jgi:hypothetical protein
MEQRVKLSRTEQALRAYGANTYAQARAIGIPYTTLRDILAGRINPTLKRLACDQDVYRAFGEDLDEHRHVLCSPETADAQPVEQERL